MIRRSHNYKDYLFLLVLAVLAYWPVSFMVYSVKGDAINYFLAMRYNTSESIQQGYFPYWTAYINLGYPLHGDIQSGVWNPLVFLMSLVRQYDLYWLHTEIILINFIGAAGMYRLLRLFGFERKTLLLVAAAYLLNGYITDAGQFLNWLYAAAFLPWVFLYLLRCFRSFSAKDAFGLGLSHSLMFLCAYPADSILLSYIILAFAIVSLIQVSQSSGWAVSLKKHLYVSVIALLTLLIICLPAILSFIEFIPLINRGEGVALADAMVNSLAPANLVSVILPWPTMRGHAFAATDPLIRNCYMGILTFIFLLYYFFTRHKKDWIQKFLAGVLVVFLLFSFGEYGGLRFISYHVLPLMNSFRHPANAKLFFLFAGQVLAAFAINRYLVEDQFNKKLLKRITGILFIAVTIAFIVSLFSSQLVSLLSTGSRDGSSLKEQLKNIRDQLSFYDLLLLNSLFIMMIFGITYVLLKKERFRNYFLPLMCLDLFITAQFMLPLTYYKKASASSIQAILDQQPNGYPLPDNRLSLAAFSADGELYFDKIGCLNPYNKKPGRSDYIITPSNTADQDRFWEYTSFRQKIMSYPMGYFADTVFAVRDSLAFLAFDTSHRAALADLKMGAVSRDSANVTLKQFKPGLIEFEVSNPGNAFFVLQQNHYPRWECRVDDQPVEILKTNLSFMGVQVSPGQHTIQFKYRGGWLAKLGLFSVIFGLSGMVFFTFYKKHKPTH